MFDVDVVWVDYNGGIQTANVSCVYHQRQKTASTDVGTPTTLHYSVNSDGNLVINNMCCIKLLDGYTFFGDDKTKAVGTMPHSGEQHIVKLRLKCIRSVSTPSDAPPNSGNSNLLITVEALRNIGTVGGLCCMNCGHLIFRHNGREDALSLSLVLPLPSQQWSDIGSDAFCHNHQHDSSATDTDQFIPASNKCYIGDTYILVGISSEHVTADVLNSEYLCCGKCQALLGKQYTDKVTKLYLSSVTIRDSWGQWNSHNNAMDCSNTGLQLLNSMVERIMYEIFVHLDKSGECQQYVCQLPDAVLPNATATATGTPSSITEPMRIKPLQLRILNSNGLEGRWSCQKIPNSANSSVQNIEIHLRLSCKVLFNEVDDIIESTYTNNHDQQIIEVSEPCLKALYTLMEDQEVNCGSVAAIPQYNATIPKRKVSSLMKH